MTPICCLILKYFSASANGLFQRFDLSTTLSIIQDASSSRVCWFTFVSNGKYFVSSNHRIDDSPISPTASPLPDNGKTFARLNNVNIRARMVALLVERSLPIPEVRGLNPVIGKNYIEHLLSTALKRRK